MSLKLNILDEEMSRILSMVKRELTNQMNNAKKVQANLTSLWKNSSEHLELLSLKH